MLFTDTATGEYTGDTTWGAFGPLDPLARPHAGGGGPFGECLFTYIVKNVL